MGVALPAMTAAARPRTTGTTRCAGIWRPSHGLAAATARDSRRYASAAVMTINVMLWDLYLVRSPRWLTHDPIALQVNVIPC